MGHTIDDDIHKFVVVGIILLGISVQIAVAAT